MTQQKIPLIDRLRDRGFVDQWGFILFAVSGSGLIIFAKSFGIPGQWVACGAIAVMFVYALIIAHVGTGRLRADQAGDNCYYLGLIYTLASLSFAIATFDPDHSASTIVQGFGIALASTVAGLVLRVFFSQGRPDLENIEEQARLELTKATSRLKGELSHAVVSMSDFRRQIHQSLAEMGEIARKDMEDAASASVSDVRTIVEEATAGLKEMVDAAARAIRDEASGFASRSKRYANAFDGLLVKLESHSGNLDRITASHELLAAAADESSQIARQALASLGSLNEQSKSTLAVGQALRESATQFNQQMEQVRATIEALEKSVLAFQEESARRLAEMPTIPEAVMQGATKAISSAASALERQLVELASVHQRVSDRISDQTEAALDITRRHNEELDEQLRRSRQALADMQITAADPTAHLARDVDASA